jgi:hypothetical protein
MTKKQLQEEVLSLTNKAAQQEDTVKALRQHIVSRLRTIQSEHEEKQRLLNQCLAFASLVRALPSGIVDDEMISKTSFIKASYTAAMKENASLEDRMARVYEGIREEVERNGESGDGDADASGTDDGKDEENTSSVQSNSPEKKNSNEKDERNQTPSPVKQSAEHSIKGREELSIEEAIEESNVQKQEHQLLQSQQGLQPPLLEEDKPPASANSTKRDLSSSDDSDAGDGKPDLQRRKGEHGAVTRPKSTRSIRWGAAHESSTAVAFGMAMELDADQQQAKKRSF